MYENNEPKYTTLMVIVEAQSQHISFVNFNYITQNMKEIYQIFPSYMTDTEKANLKCFSWQLWGVEM
ncbi:CLUMA_CG019262, isoform A [Clunio marinus]|uniref:CLUMA_CG019262, isoform A n=1 Tax=Clunio marinus TaxID=568069 RepID=A0A1J1J3W8_9DIPT|nr:CLUMA_CG019262, isoform A [Clunio marinus]